MLLNAQAAAQTQAAQHTGCTAAAGRASGPVGGQAIGFGAGAAWLVLVRQTNPPQTFIPSSITCSSNGSSSIIIIIIIDILSPQVQGSRSRSDPDQYICPSLQSQTEHHRPRPATAASHPRGRSPTIHHRPTDHAPNQRLERAAATTSAVLPVGGPAMTLAD